MNSIPMHIKQRQTLGMFIDHIYQVDSKRNKRVMLSCMHLVRVSGRG